MRYFADKRFLEYDNRKAVWETVSVALPGGAPQQPPQTPIWFIPLTPKGNNARERGCQHHRRCPESAFHNLRLDCISNAGIVRSSAYDFIIWAAAGTSDSAYRETLNQIEGMARLPEVFNTANMTFHEKDGARHEYRPTKEYLFNALVELFPASSYGW